MTPQQGRTRRWLLLMGTLGATSACRDAVAPRVLTPPDPAAVIVDGAHNSGNDDVFFLPPLVDNPSSASGFGDPEQLGLPVNIKINCSSHPSTSACPNFDFPPSAVKSSSDAHYMVNWDTKAPGVDPGDVYRIEVRVGDKILAWADVFLVPNGNPKNVATQGDIPLPDGRTLPIKVRIEKGWDCNNRSSKNQCVTQVVPNVAVDGSGSTIVQFPGTDAEPAGGGRFYDGWIPYSDNCQPGSTTCVPTGTPVVVTVEDQTSILNASGATCSLKNPQTGVPLTKMLTQLGTGEAEHPGRCVKFTTNPKFQFARRVDVAVCVESPTPTQQLLKYDIGETPRFLQNVFFPIVCEPSTIGSTTRSRSANPALNFALNTLSRAGRALSGLFTPKSAYAIHLGVGGLIPPGGSGGGFSFVAPAEPYTETVVGEYQQTAVVNTSVPGPQSRITTVHPSLTPAVGQNVRCEITGGGGSLGSLGGPAQVVVQTQAVRNEGGAIVDAVATCPAWYLGPAPGANTLQMVALSIDDGTSAAEDDGEGGTQIETLHGVTTFSATGINPPDLTVANVTVAPSSQYATRNVNLNFQVRNNGGDMSATTTSSVLVAISSDQTLSEDDATFGPFTVESIKSGAFLNFSLFPAIPADRNAGNQYILLIADPNGTVAEANENNNFASIPITVLQPQSAAIDFETLPNETPTCSFCDLTSQYASRGVNFSFVQASTGTIQAPSLLVMPSRDDPQNAGNHLVSSPTTPDGANGFSSGRLQLIFTNAPGYVSFIGAVNDGVPYSPNGSGDGPLYTVRAFDASGQPIPTANISVTVNSRYTSTSGVLFRRDFITVGSARGISLVEIVQTNMVMLFDNLSFSTFPPIL